MTSLQAYIVIGTGPRDDGSDDDYYGPFNGAQAAFDHVESTQNVPCSHQGHFVRALVQVWDTK